MISAVAFCPHPPLLVPRLAAGAAGDLGALRVACGVALGRLAAPRRRIVLLGAGESSRSHSPLARGGLSGYGVAIEVNLGGPGCSGALGLPLSLTVGAWLVREAFGPHSGAVGFSVAPAGFAGPAAAELVALAERDDIALVVMGDGSARRGPSAPGYLDERAIPFDDGVVAALRAGDAAALAGLDVETGHAVLAAGVPAWRAAGRLLDGGSYDAEVHYADDPYGVSYVVATWATRD
ncbi:MAG: hypothetical protein ABJB93_06890 [Gaiellales bacterium]|nr:hypothetical protein [Actinomycetota bacterium]